MRTYLNTLAFTFVLSASLANAATQNQAPVVIGLDAEFGHQTSTSAEAIKRGMLIAIDEINAAGGVLGGRPLTLETRDNRSVPARGVANVKELAEIKDLVGVFVGKFSPVAQEVLPIIHERKLPLLDPWAAADNIVDNGFTPNYVFRLSLRDEWAMQTLFKHATKNNHHQVGLLLPNTGWGRSSLKAAETYAKTHDNAIIVKSLWYNWGDNSLLPQYQEIAAAKAQAILFVGNEREGSIFAKELASLPPEKRLPILSHWGVTGGNFVELVGTDTLQKIDLSVVQTFSFIGNSDPAAIKVVNAYNKKFNTSDARQIESPVGVAHAYELTHLLALAINKVGSTNREAIRDALETLPAYKGLFGSLSPPFTATRHDALSASYLFMARFATDGAIERIR